MATPSFFNKLLYYKKLLKEIEKNEQKLFGTLSNEQIKLYEKCIFDTLEANSISEKESFKRGFRLGVRMVLESIKGEI